MKWMDLEIILLSKVRKRKKITYDIIYLLLSLAWRNEKSIGDFPDDPMVDKPPASPGDMV